MCVRLSLCPERCRRGLGLRARVRRRIFRRIEWVFGRYCVLQIEVQVPCAYCTISSSAISIVKSAHDASPLRSAAPILSSKGAWESSQLTELIDHYRQQGHSRPIDDRQESSRGVRLYAHENELLLLDVSARLICGALLTDRNLSFASLFWPWPLIMAIC